MTLSAKTSLMLGEYMAGFRREGHNYILTAIHLDLVYLCNLYSREPF